MSVLVFVTKAPLRWCQFVQRSRANCISAQISYFHTVCTLYLIKACNLTHFQTALSQISSMTKNSKPKQQNDEPVGTDEIIAKYWTIDPVTHKPLATCGFSIVRCTYSSQSEWDKYISRIQAEIRNSLSLNLEIDLDAAINVSVVEDKERLDSATWKEARLKFDELVLEELKIKTTPEEARDDPELEKRLMFAMISRKRIGFFVFADQASVDSVVDCNTKEDKRAHGKYYFTLIASGLTTPIQYCEDEDGIVNKDCETCRECRQALYQKFKVNDLVLSFAAVAGGDNWPDRCLEQNDGISSLDLVAIEAPSWTGWYDKSPKPPSKIRTLYEAKDRMG